MDSKKVLADFQFVRNRVSNFSIETKSLGSKNSAVDVNYDIDYNILEMTEEEDQYVGLLELIIIIKAKMKNSVLFKVHLTMEGFFRWESEEVVTGTFWRDAGVKRDCDIIPSEQSIYFIGILIVRPTAPSSIADDQCA